MEAKGWWRHDRGPDQRSHLLYLYYIESDYSLRLNKRLDHLIATAFKWGTQRKNHV